MEQKTQIKLTDTNRQDLYRIAYPHLNKSKADLVQLDQYNASLFILADCCGWYYKQHWPNKNIIGLETLSSIQAFEIPRSNFQGIIDNQDRNNVRWPSVKLDGDCALVFDYSIMLKYHSVPNIVDIVSTAANKYNANIIVIRAATMLIDDCRLVDRFFTLCKLQIPNYIVTDFAYDHLNIKISYKKKINV